MASVLAASALVGTGAIAFTGIAHADESTPVAALETFNAEDFAAQAAELPAGLTEAIQRDLGISAEAYLANAEAAKAAADAAIALSASGVGVEGVAIDGQDVTIYVAAEADVEAVASIGAKVEVGKPASDDYSDENWEAKRDHKGGYGYTFVPSLGRCSVGFSGYNTANGADQFLTAGHCGVDDQYNEKTEPVHHLELDEPLWDAPTWVAADELGSIAAGSMNFGPGVEHDGGLIDLNDDWTGVPEVAGWGGGSGHPDAESVTVYDSIGAVLGADACKSGATSGWTCGEIIDTETSVTFQTGEDVTGFVFEACMLAGDSGGSIVVGNYALGVNSGSTFGDCDDDGIGIGYAVEGPEGGSQYNAFSLYGDSWELNVEVNAPVIDDAFGDENGATIRGTVANAGATHRATVNIDGLGDFEVEIDGDGEFVIEVEEELEVGAEYSYTAQAFYGNFSQSEATSGSFVVEEGEPEPDVEPLVVESPSDGQTTSNARPPFEGTGEPGADVTLTVGDNEFGESTIEEDGSWEISPESDLPRGARFDATVTQVAGEDVQSVTVSDLGISQPDVTITVPEDGAEVAGDVVFEGTSFPGALVGLQIEGPITQADAAEASVGAASGELAAADEDEDLGTWEGEFEIDEDGNWSFAPDEALEDGEYTLTAYATAEDGDPELTDSQASVDFTVVTRGDDDEDEDEDGDELPDTGSSSLPIILVGVGLLAAGGAAFAIRARRNATTV
jgi:LPXTG-motif cell wall-anchored protein